MAELKKKTFADLYQCSKELIYVVFFIREILQGAQYRKEIKSYKERWYNLPGGFLYTIRLMTGEEYELKIVFSQDSKKEVLEFQNISSRRDKLSIHGTVDPSNIKKKLTETVVKYLLKRTRGFNTEKLALEYLESVVRGKKSGLILNVRKGNYYEDVIKKQDIIVSACFDGKPLTVSFDLKNNQEAIDLAVQKKSRYSTIFTNEQELKSTPEKFLERVHELIIKKFRREGFGIEVGTGAADMHIGSGGRK